MQHPVFRRRFSNKLRIAPLLILLAALSVTAVSVAHAEPTAHTIPLEGVRWATYVINVNLPAAPDWAHDAVVDALNTWTQAQRWFANKYFPGGQTYDFALSTNSNESAYERVLVQFIGGNDSCAGRTDVSYMERSRAITFANASLPQSYNGKSLDSSDRPWFTRLAIRAFGHVLGLDWVDFCDVMQPGNDPTCQASSPSTLDLYAVHILAEGSLPRNVTLPSTIPYMTMPQASSQPPYFPMVLLLASFGLVSCSAVALRKRSAAPSGRSEF